MGKMSICLGLGGVFFKPDIETGEIMGKCPCRTKSVGGAPSQYYPEALSAWRLKLII